MGLNDSDVELGRRLASSLDGRRPVALPMVMGILEDLMAADVSLLPALQILAGQPIFLKFINSPPDALLLPLKDSLIAAAQDTLAGPLVSRVESFLSGYLGVGAPARQVGVAAEPSRSRASFRSLVQAGEAGFPATQIADYGASEAQSETPLPTLLSNPADQHPLQPSAGQGSAPADRGNNVSSWLQSIPAWSALPLVAVVAWVVLFKVPAVCNAFDLCTEASKPATKDNDKNKEGDKTSEPKAGSTSTDKANPARPTNPAPTVQEAPVGRRQAPPPPAPQYEPPAPQYAPAPSYQPAPTYAQESPQPSSSAPLRDEPLW